MRKNYKRIALIAIIALILIFFQFDRLSSYFASQNFSVTDLFKFNAGQMTSEAPKTGSEPDASSKVKSQETGAKTNSSPKHPEFQVTHVRPTGKIHLAGLAEPGWGLELRSADKVIAKFKADERDGRWFHALEKPLAPGSYTFSLLSISPDGKQMVTAKDTITFTIDSQTKETADVSRQDSAQPGTMLKNAPEPQKNEQKTQNEQKVQSAEASKDQNSSSDKKILAQSDPKKNTVSLPFLSIDGIIYKTLRNKKTQLSVSGTGLPGMDIRLLVDQQVAGHQTVNENGKWSFKLDRAMNAVNHSIRVEQRDKSGQILAWLEEMFKPEVPVVTAKSDQAQSTVEKDQTDSKASAEQKPVEVKASETRQSESKQVEQKSETIARAEVQHSPAKEEKPKAEAPKTEIKSEPTVKTETVAKEEVKEKSSQNEAAKVVAQVTEKTAPQTREMVKGDDQKSAAVINNKDKPVATGSLHEKKNDGPKKEIRAKRTKISHMRHASKGKKRRVVIVKPGDTLWKIAERHYGDGEKYRKVYRKNQDQIIRVQKIYPGQRLVLP